MTAPTPELDELVDDVVDRLPITVRARLYRVALAVSTILGGLILADVVPDGGPAGTAAAVVAWLVSVLGNGLATVYTRPAK
jgi:hypothetical protein